jgi:hypothetical protein
MCAIYKASTCERAWKAVGDSLQAPSYLSKVDQYRKFRARKQRRDIGKYSCLKGSITDWTKLPEEAILTFHVKAHIFKTRFRKVKTSEGK